MGPKLRAEQMCSIPDPTRVADHDLPDGSTITARKGWLGDQAWVGQRTLAIEHRDPDGSLRRRTVWALGLAGRLLCLAQGSISR